MLKLKYMLYLMKTQMLEGLRVGGGLKARERTARGVRWLDEVS